MTSPVQISDLPVATSAADNDLLLLRKGLTDYQCAVSIIRNINLQALDPIPGGTPIQTDLMLVSRVISGQPQNFSVQFCQVGFPKGTRMWFYNALPPTPNWSLVNGTGGNLLAAQDFNTTYAGNATAGNSAGTWQQQDHVLTIAQIPAHSHNYQVFKSDIKDNLSFKIGSTNKTTNNTTKTQDTGGGQGHNHGNTWRPLANVGVIGNKDY